MTGTDALLPLRSLSVRANLRHGLTKLYVKWVWRRRDGRFIGHQLHFGIWRRKWSGGHDRWRVEWYDGEWRSAQNTSSVSRAIRARAE